MLCVVIQLIYFRQLSIITESIIGLFEQFNIEYFYIEMSPLFMYIRLFTFIIFS